jgi:tetratricopeptide (TPR) repeat protein
MRLGRRGAWAVVTIAVCLAAGSAARGQIESLAQSRRYADCMDKARLDPAIGHKAAQAWRAGGGGMAARHCAAVALLGLGQYAEAAQMLRTLADGAGAKGAGFRFELLTQAANAWMIAGKPNTAYEIQTEALKARPHDIELLIDRSISLASTQKYWRALDDLNLALELDPLRADALIFRASAYRRLDELGLARENIARALAIAPHHLEALLERGIIRRLDGDKAGARKDWSRVVEIGSDTPEGAAARLNLERMDQTPR